MPTSSKYTNASDGPRGQNYIIFALVVIIVLALVPFAYTGTFARYQADDYCSAQLLRTQGYWAAQWASYTGWSNRFSTMLVTGLIDPLGVVGMQILPGLLILGLLLSIYLLLQRVLSFIEVNVSRIALFGLAGVITFFGLYTTPNQFQSYYWRSGSITYTLPIILLLMLLGFLVKRREKQATWWQVGLIGFFSFFAGGFSETNAALQITLLVLGLAGILVYGRKMGPANRSHALWIGALVGAFAAIGVILLSPGNAIRMSQMPEPPGFFRWVYLSFRYALGFVYNGLVGTILPRGFSFLFGLAGTLIFVWKGIRAKSIIWSLLAIPAAVFLLAAAVCAPSAYAQSAYPENRALTGINLILTAGVILEGCMLGVLFQIWMEKQPIITSAVKHNLAVGAVLLLSGYLIYGGIQVLKGAAYYQTRAAAWDTRAAQIEEFRLSGDTSPVVTALDSTNGVAELSSDPYNWVNLCAATYYQVEQITAK